MRTFTQSNRRLQFHSDAAGDDVLQIIAFKGEEELSRPFHFRVDLISEKNDVDPAKLVGTRVSFAVLMADEENTPRWFDGFVSQFSYRGTDDRANLSQYRAEVVPWIWFMGLTSDCRIFQNQTIPQIVEKVFGECPHVAMGQKRLSGKYPTLEYCVQYRESDFNFVSRLMERAGIYYYFTHEQGAHKLVLADSKDGYVDCKESIIDLQSTRTQNMDDESLLTWEHRAQYQSGALASTDYNFETPGTNLKTSAVTTMKFDGVAKQEIFEYPGNYPKTSEGDAYTHIRMEEQETLHDIVHARSECVSFHPGGRFTIGEHYNPIEKGKSWVIVQIKHEGNLGGAYGTVSSPDGEDQSEDDLYVNEFVCIPSATTFRPARITPRPNVGGLQTAVVVGESGQEIQVDKYGRIRVQFFWDRYGKHGASASRWIRVAQTWAGAGYGAWFLPRIGHEVVVAFEEGDPDSPMIVGSVYHATNHNPFAQPGNKTQSGIRTHSTLGGGPGNFNEIKFEDKKGSELLYVQAEKDRSVLAKHNNAESVGHDETIHVGHDRTKTVDNNETTFVHANRTETVDANETITIHANRTETVDANETISIGGSRTETVSQSETLTVAIAQAITVGAAQTVTVGGAQAITVGASQTTTVGASQTNTIGSGQTTSIGGAQSNTIADDQSTTVGGNEVSQVGGDRSASVAGEDTLAVTKKITVQAGDEITITTGSASISMKKDGTISISGKDITIDASGEINIKASKNVTIKGQKILQN